MNSQLKLGIRTEREHRSTYMFIQNYYKKFGKMPSQTDVYKHIASNHLSENPKYYTKLNKARL